MSNVEHRTPNVEGLGRSPCVRPQAVRRFFTSTFDIRRSVFDILPFPIVAELLHRAI